MTKIYQAIEEQRREKKPRLLKKKISEDLGKMASQGNFIWQQLQKGKTRMNLTVKMANAVGLEIYIKHEEGETKINAEDESFYKVINWERQGFGYTETATLCMAPTSHGNFWKQVKKNNLKYNDVVTVCDAMGLQIIAKNDKVSYLLNHPKLKK